VSLWEQLDGALPHFFHHVHALLDREFTDYWIEKDPFTGPHILQI